jgi:hypothetical protein
MLTPCFVKFERDSYSVLKLIKSIKLKLLIILHPMMSKLYMKIGKSVLRKFSMLDKSEKLKSVF